MDKPSIPSPEEWSLMKWGGAAIWALALGLGRVLLGDMRTTLKDNTAQIIDLSNRITVIETKLQPLEQIAEYLHALKKDSAFAQHVKRHTKKHARKLKQLEKINA